MISADSGTSPSAARVRLSVLGVTELRLEGSPVFEVLAQPKRLALFAYLALARPGAFQRRDRLLGVFWPSSTPDRARANLRQGIRFLRRALGEGCIVGRGDGELAVGPGVEIDALEFRRLLEADDLEGALDRYRGELLPGLFVSGAPDFEHWLSGERRELREAARDAAGVLADAGASHGRIREATEWARRAVAVDPLDEVAVRRVLRLLIQGGGRSEAVAVYHDFRRRLEARLELHPSSETEAIISEVRRGSGSEAIQGAVPPQVALDPMRVVVLPYRSRMGTREGERAGAMAADWIAQGLARNPELAVVPPFVARSAMQETDPDLDPGGQPSEPPLQRVALEYGAGTVVTGTVVAQGAEVLYHTTVFDAVRGRLIPPPEPVTSPGIEPSQGLAALRDAVAGCLAPLLSTKKVHAQRAAPPPSYGAYSAYLEGLDRFIAGDWVEALEAFLRIEDDGDSYPLARIVSAIAMWNLRRLPEALELTRRSEQQDQRLGPFERGTLDMVSGWLRGDWRAAYAGARRQAALAPGSLSSFQVAEEARRLNRPREALAILESLDPSKGELRGWIFYWVELCTAYHLVGDHSAELVAAQRALSLHPGEPVATLLEAQALAALGDLDVLSERGYRILATPPGGAPSPGAVLRRIALEVRAHGNEGESLRYLDRALEWWDERPEEATAVDRRERALALYHAGRLEEAAEHLQRLRSGADEVPQSLDEHHGHLRGHLDEGYLALISEQLGDREQAQRWRQYLEDLDHPFLYGASWLWRGVLSAQSGDLDRGATYLRRAFIEGLPFSLALHRIPGLEPLRSHPGFRGIVAAKG